MTKGNKCALGVIALIYALVVVAMVYLIYCLNRSQQVPVQVTVAEQPIAIRVEPPRKDMETLVSESIKSKYVDLISTTALRATQKYRFPIWFTMAVTCSESEDWTGNINPYAYMKACNARGCLQITPICLAEYNDWHEVKYTMDDMWNVAINYEVGCWYLARIRDHYLKDYNWTYEDIYLAYNVGPGAFKKYRQDYYNGYDVMRHCDYNALKRYEVYQDKYLKYFN